MSDSRSDDTNGRKGFFAKRRNNVILAVVGVSSVVALIIYSSSIISSPVQQPVEAEDMLGKVLVTRTMTSIQDPGAGHETHQVVMFLPPLADDVIYSGTLTWAASGPIELFTYHHYDGPTNNSPPLYAEPSNNVTYASPLFFIPPASADHGSMQLAASAIGFHSLQGSKFTVTATFDGWTKKVDLIPYSDNVNNSVRPVPSLIITPTTVDPRDMNYTILSENEIQNLLEMELKGWELVDGKLHKTFQFDNFSEAFQFMYKVGLEAEEMNHHPDWTNNYDTVSAYLYTWSVDNKITDYDVRLAEIMDREAAALG
ncbi:MAG TPA: 4a-hydroxytetrahydrobiopterin dehydratase [Nitrososphaera sp.]|jgi:4a-hydroxytetrahydrobiopterin dehydratase